MSRRGPLPPATPKETSVILVIQSTCDVDIPLPPLAASDAQIPTIKGWWKSSGSGIPRIFAALGRALLSERSADIIFRSFCTVGTYVWIRLD